MNKKTLFDYDDYKKYLLNLIAQMAGQGRGYRSKIALAAGCRVAFVSQVLGGDLNFSLEQAEGINSLLNHSSDESDFFLLLVQFGRAGTQVLRNRLNSQITAIREKRLNLKERVDIKTTLDPISQATYYSSWHYAAVHILITIAQYQTKEAIAAYFKVSKKRIAEIIEFLDSVGLIQIDGPQVKSGVARIFLGSDSPMIAKHHTNWRMRAIDSLDQEPTSAVHLSTLLSVSKKDVLRMKEQIIKSIEETRGIARESVPEEELFCFNVDFFRVQ